LWFIKRFDALLLLAPSRETALTPLNREISAGKAALRWARLTRSWRSLESFTN
jgi:hypothetical protein